NSASSSTAATARPRRAGPSPSAVGAAGAPSTRRLVVGVRGSPAPTPAACESWTAVSERGSQAISPYPVNSGSVSPTARQSLRTSFQEGHRQLRGAPAPARVQIDRPWVEGQIQRLSELLANDPAGARREIQKHVEDLRI